MNVKIICNIIFLYLNEYLHNIEVPRLSDTESNELEGIITINEAGETLKKT